MKKTLIYCLAALIGLSSLTLSAVSKKDLWMNAITERDVNVKMQKLLEYKAEYDDPKDENYLYLYFNLTVTAFQVKKFSESIELGEKTLNIPNLQDNNRLDLYLILANAYNVTNQDLNKAVEYAKLVSSTAENLKKMASENTETITRMDSNYIAPALRIQAKIYVQLGKTNPEMFTNASRCAIDAYLIDKQQTTLAFAYNAFGSLANAKKFPEAVAIMEEILKHKEGSAREYDALAKIYYQMDNRDRAVEYFEKAYQIEGSGEAAAQLGKLIYKKDPIKAIEYLADEFAYTQDRESQTFKLLEHLYFNVVYKDKTGEEKETGFKSLLETAQGRIKK